MNLTLRQNVLFRGKTTGLEQWSFVHNALPELSLGDVDTSSRFLDHLIALPLMVSCMTGGYAGAERINRQLAEVCEECSLPLGVGSQRQALEDATHHRSYSVVRAAAPTIPIVGNIGAAEIARWTDAGPGRRLVDLIRADALAIHLNPLQEYLQPEGTPDFRGVLRAIAMLARDLPVPIIVKEIGAGMSASVARRLLDAGVKILDVAGAGGTSWAGVEALRSKEPAYAERFWNWGIPTAEAIRDVAALKAEGHAFMLIGSGGVSSGRDVAVCLGLGADLTASARPFLKQLSDHGTRGLRTMIQEWGKELRGIMFLTGSRTLRDLREAPLRKDSPR